MVNHLNPKDGEPTLEVTIGMATGPDDGMFQVHFVIHSSLPNSGRSNVHGTVPVDGADEVVTNIRQIAEVNGIKIKNVTVEGRDWPTWQAWPNMED